MKYDYSKLHMEIINQFYTVEIFAEAMGTTAAHVFDLLSGVAEWTQAEIDLAAVKLDIHPVLIPVYFFHVAA